MLGIDPPASNVFSRLREHLLRQQPRRNEGVPGSSPGVGFKPGFACGHRADLDGNPASHTLSPERRGGGRVGRRARPPLG